MLEYSLRKHASLPLDITWMALNRQPGSMWSGWNSASWSTPFTPFRWAAPEACGFKGRAIYMDTDVFALADIAELWTQPMAPGVMTLMRETEGKLRTCVLLFDCAVAKDIIPPVKSLKQMSDAHKHMVRKLRDNRSLIGAFEGKWNCIDLKRCEGVNDPTVKLVHYSQMTSQPHLGYAEQRLAKRGLKHWYDGEREPHFRPELTAKFEELLSEASAHGFTPEKYEPAILYGEYRKRSQKGRKAKWARRPAA